MTSASKSPSRSRRLAPVLVTATLLAGGAATVGFMRMSRAADAERARSRAGAELAAFERCLIGAPLEKDEELSGRVRGIELAIALTRAALDTEPETESNGSDAADARANSKTDADAKAKDKDKTGDEPTGARWPARCAPLAETLGRTLDSAALDADRSLDALRSALPTGARLEMPYALRPDEAADLTAAIASASLPAPKGAPDNEPAPIGLAAPLTPKDLAPLGKGTLPLNQRAISIAPATDVLATRTLRLLIRDTGTRLCTLEADDAKGAYSTARCGDLPAEWKDKVELANLEDGAPTALLVDKRTPGSDGSSSTVGGVVIFAPGGNKTLPMNGGGVGASAFLAKDGSYMLSSSAYLSFVRIGNVAKLKTTNLDQPLLDTETARALPPNPDSPAAAYGHIFWMDPPPLYTSYDPSRELRVRKVLPTLAGGGTGLGSTASSYSSYIGLRAGCQSAGRTALLFTFSGLPSPFSPGDFKIRDTKKTVVLAVAEADGAFKRLDAEIGDSTPHLTCLQDAAVVTSIGATKDRGQAVVIESRCTSAGCVARSSEPIPVPAGDELDAATTDTGVALVWKLAADQVTSQARGMAFYRHAPLDKLAAAPPRPLLENRRRGGMDIDHIRLISRGPAVIVAIESGGKTPHTYALRIDAGGAVSAVQVEETKW